MELRHLRYFCAVAQERSFTAASRVLHVSQSGVSGQVRDLKRELGVRLFSREAREVRLTPEGVMFLEEARAILERAEQAMEAVRRSHAGETGALTVGLCGPVTSAVLPGIFREFRRRLPGVKLALRERAPAEQVEQLLAGRIDVAFTRGVPVAARPHVHARTYLEESLMAVLPEDHPLCAAEAVPVAALAKERLVLFCREGAPEVFDAIVTMCRRAHFSPRLADAPSSWQAVLTMVAAGEGLGVVPACVQSLSAGGVVFRRLAGRGVGLQAYVVWRRGETNGLVDLFLRDLWKVSGGARGGTKLDGRRGRLR